jgi:hypothetical protein
MLHTIIRRDNELLKILVINNPIVSQRSIYKYILKGSCLESCGGK